jgi:hypothetical protein
VTPDAANFLRLVTDRDPEADIPLAIRLDITPDQAEVMAPGVEDYDERRRLCTLWLENFLMAFPLRKLPDHLEYLKKLKEGKRGSA